MGEYWRSRVGGGTYFFTVVLAERESRVLVERIDLLRAVVKRVKTKRPFHIEAWVVLPDHLHCVWTMPVGDADYSGRWRDIKKGFSMALPKAEVVSANRAKRGERGIWQRRFWEHTIRDDADYAAHIDYVHLNPYKHGLVTHVQDWPYSTFHRYVKAEFYTPDWMTGPRK